MKIAIIGSGIAGNTVAYHLHKEHEVTVFEAGNHIGGHTHTHRIGLLGQDYNVDTGFIVFNDRTYPNFIRMLDELGVASQPSDMSFSVRCEKTGLEYNGHSLNTLFAQRRNLVRPSFYRLVADILRFNRIAQYDDGEEEMTVGGFLARHRLSLSFAENYLLPMGAAIWSCPIGTFARFPIRFIIEFYRGDERGVILGLSTSQFVSVVIAPLAVLMLLRREQSLGRLLRAAIIIAFAGALYRFDTFLVAFNPGPGWSYFPSVTEQLITIGLVAAEIAIYIAVEAPLSGMSMNPARSFGPGLVARMWDGMWIYFVAPPLGMLLAAEVHLRQQVNAGCAKLYHAGGVRCIFCERISGGLPLRRICVDRINEEAIS